MRSLHRIVWATARYGWEGVWRRTRRSNTTPGVDAVYVKVVNELSHEFAKPDREPEELVRLVAEATHSALTDPASTTSLLRALKADSPRMLFEHRRLNAQFEKRIVKRWGAALDLFYMIEVICEEIGADGYKSAQSSDLSDDQEALLEAVSGLHARACRTALEVYELLASGFPKGAHARARTIHELAVVSMVLSSAAKKPGFEDIGSRFVAFDSVVNARDAEEHQRYAARLHFEPFTPEEMAEIHAARDDAIARFPDIDKRIGWAGNLPGVKQRTFEELELIAGLDHLRPYYTWASHEVHASPKGVRLNRVRRPGGQVKLAGRTNRGLADPAQTALIALNQVTAAVLNCPGVPSPSRLLGANAISLLIEEACSAFVRAELALRRQAGEGSPKGLITNEGVAVL